MPGSINLIYCHPYPDRSRAGRVLLDSVRDLPAVKVRSLYQLYPDFDIDVEAEQEALVEAALVVWQGPFYWYGVPALLSLWFEKVLAQGWAYGEGARALRGKTALWVTTTGAPEPAFHARGIHGHPFAAFVPAISQTARFCGMHWADPPLVVHGAHRISNGDLRQAGLSYRARLEALARSLGVADGGAATTGAVGAAATVGAAGGTGGGLPAGQERGDG